ncbi:hypothetical protein BH10BAC5_BH10BAC5_14690 [soil metagenome]
MDTQKKDEQLTSMFSDALAKPLSRKSFLKWTGVSAAVLGFGISLNGCKTDDNIITPGSGINFGSGDVAVLNYAYALEQLEAAFYIKVVSSFYTGATAAEIAILNDIALHERGHRDFFKAAIPTSARIADGLTFNFSTIDFTSRASVLGAAKAFEDTGVQAYNGVAYRIANVDYLGLAGKIVSVEARHSAVIRDLISPHTDSFAGSDIIADSSGLEYHNLPSAILPLVAPYFTVTVNAGDLP